MWVRTSLVAFVLCLTSLGSTLRAQLSPVNATYTVTGTVVNSVTGEPIQRVLVQLHANSQRRLLTGADGKFQFQNVPAGMVDIALQKPGYFPEHAIRSRRGQPTFITAGPNQRPAVLKMVPESIIFGRVMGDSGEWRARGSCAQREA